MSSPPPSPLGNQQLNTTNSNSAGENYFGLPEYALFQKEKLPLWLTQAYEQIDSQEELSAIKTDSDYFSLEEKEEALASQEGLFLTANDDMDMGLGDYGTIDYIASPFSIKKGILMGQSRPPRPIFFWIAISMAMLSLLIAALFLGKENKNFSQIITSILPFKKTEMSNLQFSDLNSYRLNRGSKKPSVFIIEGKVTNHYEVPCHAVKVKGILFDEKNKKIAEEIVYCGNTLKEKEIKAYSQKKIDKLLKNPIGSTKPNVNIDPGQSIPFMILFFNPPKKEFEFSIEILKYTLDRPEEIIDPKKNK